MNTVHGAGRTDGRRRSVGGAEAAWRLFGSCVRGRAGETGLDRRSRAQAQADPRRPCDAGQQMMANKRSQSSSSRSSRHLLGRPFCSPWPNHALRVLPTSQAPSPRVRSEIDNGRTLPGASISRSAPAAATPLDPTTIGLDALE